MERIFVGPDNGLLAAAVAMSGGAARAVELTNADFHLPSPGPTFAGRDIFAPVVAQLCNGAELSDLGERHRSDRPAARHPSAVARSRTAASPPKCCGSTASATRSSTSGSRTSRAGATGSPSRGEPSAAWLALPAPTGRSAPATVGLVVDSYGLLSLVVDRGSAAEELGLRPSLAVRLEPATSSRPMRSGTTIVVVLLLLLIVGAALLQFVVLAR